MSRINEKALREGDFVFTRSLLPIGFLTQAFVGGPELHVGQLIDRDSNGVLYMAEMVGDLKHDNDIEINPLSKLTGYGILRPRIVCVKRAAAYDDPEVRYEFRRRVLVQRAHYDFLECLALAFDAPRLNRKGLICSGFCFLNGMKDGILWSDKLLELPYAPSPKQLSAEAVLEPVEWGV